MSKVLVTGTCEIHSLKSKRSIVSWALAVRNREEQHMAALNKLGGSEPNSTRFVALCTLGYG
jgi:hypothetical protein